jgi:Putative lumazine-binding
MKGMNKQQSSELSMVASAGPEHVEEVRGTIATYLSAVKANDIETLRGLFDAKANVAHYHVKKDTVVTNTLDEFMGVIQSLHAKFDNAEEIGEAMNVRLVKHLASVELNFCFVMGPNQLRGTDLFNLARQNGKWVIIHKSYWL